MVKDVLNVQQIIFLTNKHYNVKNVLRIDFMTKLKSYAYVLLRKSFGQVNSVFLAIIQSILIVKKWIAFTVQISKFMM